MAKLPIISGKNLLRVLTKNGFLKIRQKGSHVFVENPLTHKSSIIPIHANEDLGKGLLKSILADLSLTLDQLIAWIKR